jgi:hypothetical protein
MFHRTSDCQQFLEREWRCTYGLWIFSLIRSLACLREDKFIADVKSMHINEDVENAVDGEPKPTNRLGRFRHVEPAVESDTDYRVHE